MIVSALKNSERLYSVARPAALNRHAILSRRRGRAGRAECGGSAIERSKPLTKLVPGRCDPKFNDLRQTPQMF
jgi:hypothetical protein